MAKCLYLGTSTACGESHGYQVADNNCIGVGSRWRKLLVYPNTLVLDEDRVDHDRLAQLVVEDALRLILGKFQGRAWMSIGAIKVVAVVW